MFCDKKMIYPKVNFTMTTGRRLELFKLTMSSFMKCCLDKDLINRWIVSDDRSTDQDIQEMKSMYPFLAIYKNPVKGQAAAINWLFNQVDTEWFLHIEDDWHFINKDKFISKMYRVTQDDERIKNVTLRGWTGVYIKHGNLDYHIHTQKTLKDYDLMLKIDNEMYGYSLNPGLQHKPTVDRLGKYDETWDIANRFWDRKVAIKYMYMGYRRANLPTNYIVHTGNKNSAYAKNEGYNEAL